MSLEFEQRILRMEVDCVRASSVSREILSNGLCYLQCTLQTPHSWTVLVRALTKLTPLPFFLLPIHLLIDKFFFLWIC